MAGCCDPSGYPGAFNRATAARSIRAFEKKGLDATAAPMVEALSGGGLDGAVVIEVGAGAGTALAAMFEAGAADAIGIDISPNYEATALSFLEQRGHTDDVEWHTGDFVALADRLPRADVVFLNRVLCCYPHMETLLRAASAKSAGRLAVSYPRDRILARIVVGMINLWLKVNRNSFRVFVHDPSEISRQLTEAGFEPVEIGATPGWHWGVWARAA